MASPTRQHVRKVHVAKVADFDDQLWPINVAILILAGFVAGIVFATSDFHDPRIFYNGWVHLGVVALLVGVLFWAVVWLQGKVLRRVQLCILISLLMHLWLGMYLRDQYLAMVAVEEASRAEQTLDEPEPTTIPDYHWDGLQPLPTRQSFQEPVRTQTPEASETEPTRQPPTEEEVTVAMPQSAEPETPHREQPDPAEIRRAELSAPRRAELAAGASISRQQWKHRLEAATPAGPDLAASGVPAAAQRPAASRDDEAGTPCHQLRPVVAGAHHADAHTAARPAGGCPSLGGRRPRADPSEARAPAAAARRQSDPGAQTTFRAGACTSIGRTRRGPTASHHGQRTGDALRARTTQGAFPTRTGCGRGEPSSPNHVGEGCPRDGPPFDGVGG